MFGSDKTRKVRVAVAGIAGAAMLTLGMGAAAQAAPPSTITEPTGSLTIHKHETPGTGVNNGLEQTVATPTIDDVEFRVRQVTGIDLSTNGGWVDATELSELYNATPAEGTITGAGYTLGAEATGLTGTDGPGVVAFNGLPIGLYLVDEIATPAGVVASAPFLVTIPLTHPVNTDEWIYDVVLYPKNSVVGGEKTVEDADDVQLGDTLSYTIRGDIPNGAVTDAYRIVDNLPTQLDMTEGSVVVSAGTQPLTLDTHYTLTENPNGFQIDLTDAGRQIAYDEVTADEFAQVVVTFDALVVAVGELENQALIYPNQPSIDNNTPITPVVITKWGGITLEKLAAGTTTGLAGAVFEVWYGNIDDIDQAQPVLEGAENRTWTTLADGTIAIDGLRYSDWADGEAVVAGDAGYRYYWLVEVKAPEGYELLAEPVSFLVTDQAVNVEVEVENVPHNAGFVLPLTGGTGTLAFTIIGLLLLAAAIAYMIVRRRQGAVEAA